MRVKGPNGLVLTVSDSVGEGLLKSKDYEQVKDESKAEKPKKSTARKPSSEK